MTWRHNMDIISAQALARKKRFSDTKQSKQSKQKKIYKMWATPAGDIAALTSDPDFIPNKTWILIDIPDDKLPEFTGQNVNFSKYCVLFDLSGKSKIVYRETLATTKFKNKLIEVTNTQSSKIDAKVSKNHLRVSLADNFMHHTPDNKLSFFITQRADPHCLLETLEFCTTDLHESQYVDKLLNIAYNSKIHSIYTYVAYKHDQGNSFEEN